MKKKWLSAAFAASLVVAAAGTAGAGTDTTEPSGTEPAGTAPAGTEPAGSAAPAPSFPAEIATDIGVTEDTITVGMLADLSGAFAPLVSEIVEAQTVYWDAVNRDGGIAGRQVELLIEDNAYDVPTQLEKYEVMRDNVAIISQSTGSPHSAAIAADLVEDNLVAIPLSWYSGWPDPDFGQNLLESYTTYCVESMNGIEWLHNNREVQTVALISFPGEYGGDGDAGARMAIEELGLEIVYDGAGQVTPPSADNPNPDLERCGPAGRRVRRRPGVGNDQPGDPGDDHGRGDRAGLRRTVVGQLADVQLQAARHRVGSAPRPVLHRLDVHRPVGR